MDELHYLVRERERYERALLSGTLPYSQIRDYKARLAKIVKQINQIEKKKGTR